MNRLLLFTDGSVNVQQKIGCGACLCIDENELDKLELKMLVKTKMFENTSSTKLELQTLLWAFSTLESSSRKVMVYTDSQNITGLPERRVRLERNNYKSGKGLALKNEKLYREFFTYLDEFDIQVIKVKGHKPGREKSNIEKVFSIVDKAARRGLRNSKR